MRHLRWSGYTQSDRSIVVVAQGGGVIMAELNNYSWRDIGEGFQFEFADKEGQALAEVSFEEERG